MEREEEQHLCPRSPQRRLLWYAAQRLSLSCFPPFFVCLALLVGVGSFVVFWGFLPACSNLTSFSTRLSYLHAQFGQFLVQSNQ